MRSVANLLSCAYLAHVMPSIIEKVRATLVRGLLPPGSTRSEKLLRPLLSIVGLNQLLDYLGATLSELLSISTVYILLHDPITGLGLSICYGIIARHGGDINIDSRTEGALHGTTVSISLPATEWYSHLRRRFPDE